MEHFKIDKHGEKIYKFLFFVVESINERFTNFTLIKKRDCVHLFYWKGIRRIQEGSGGFRRPPPGVTNLWSIGMQKNAKKIWKNF